MKFYLLCITFLISFAGSVFAEARIDEMCKPLSKQQHWHRGDTVFWEKEVIPAYAEIVEKSKPHAAKNFTFKTDLSRYRWSEDKINEANRLRIQQECDINELNSSNACHHFQAFCLNSIASDTLNRSFNSFNMCTSPGENPSWCGDSFKTAEGIRGNLNQLTYVAREIENIQNGMDKNLNDYFGDVNASMEELKVQIAKAQKQSQAKIAELDQKIKDKYNRMKKEDENFNNTCSILDKCDEYIANKGYQDKHHILNQVSFCAVEAENNLKNEFEPLENLLSGLHGYNEKVELKNLALSSLENSTKQTVKEFASVYKALNGKPPGLNDLCLNLPDFCKNGVAKNYLSSPELANHLKLIPKMNIRKDIQEYNKMANEMNALCTMAKSSHIDQALENQINEKLYEFMYRSRMGQLMSVKHFRNKVPPFNQEDCFENGTGLKLISENAEGDALVKSGIEGILELQKDKAKQLKDQTGQIKYASAGNPPNEDILFKELRTIIRNDPYMVQEALRKSGNPDQALWVCKATHDLYRREKNENIGKWVVTGLAIAGAIVATVFTGGLAAPALVASISLAGGLAGYNLYDSFTARHNAERSIAIKSSNLILTSMNLPELDSNVRAAWVESAMVALPVATKILKYGSQGISVALKSSKLVGNSTQFANSTNKIVSAYQKGRAITEEMIQRGIASKLPNASPDKIKLWSEILVGTSEDMVLEISTWAAVHPDPFSEEGMRSLAVSLAMSGSVNALGPAGREFVRKYNMKKTNASLARLNTELPSSTTNSGTTHSNQSALVIKSSDDATYTPSKGQSSTTQLTNRNREDLDLAKSNSDQIELDSPENRKINSDSEIVHITQQTNGNLTPEKISQYQKQYQSYQNNISEYQPKINRKKSYSKEVNDQLDQIEIEYAKLAEHGPFMQEKVQKSINSLHYSTDQLSGAEYAEKALKKLNGLKAQAEPVITIKTKEASNKQPLEISKYKNMEDLENNFDILARKSSAPAESNTIHEVDAALISKGVPQNTLKIDENGNLNIENSFNGEKVFAVGHEGAINFAGTNSNVGGERFYAVVYDKGFINNYGIDLRNKQNIKHGSNTTPNAKDFNQYYASEGNVFVIRGEKATQAQGQIHVQMKGGYNQMNIDGKINSQSQWMNDNIRGVVEFDSNGKIIQFIPRD